MGTLPASSVSITVKVAIDGQPSGFFWKVTVAWCRSSDSWVEDAMKRDSGARVSMPGAWDLPPPACCHSGLDTAPKDSSGPPQHGKHMGGAAQLLSPPARDLGEPRSSAGRICAPARGGRTCGLSRALSGGVRTLRPADSESESRLCIARSAILGVSSSPAPPSPLEQRWRAPGSV